MLPHRKTRFQSLSDLPVCFALNLAHYDGNVVRVSTFPFYSKLFGLFRKWWIRVCKQAQVTNFFGEAVCHQIQTVELISYEELLGAGLDFRRWNIFKESVWGHYQNIIFEDVVDVVISTSGSIVTCATLERKLKRMVLWLRLVYHLERICFRSQQNVSWVTQHHCSEFSVVFLIKLHHNRRAATPYGVPLRSFHKYLLETLLLVFAVRWTYLLHQLIGIPRCV